jgi:hypothetical protein
MTKKRKAPFDCRAAAANLRKRFDNEEKARIARLKRASSDAAAIIAMIRTEFNPKRIYQWGSLLRTKDFNAILTGRRTHKRHSVAAHSAAGMRN